MDVVWVALGAGAGALAVWLIAKAVARFRVTDDAAFWDGIAEKYAKQAVANPDAFEAKIAITKSRMKPTDVVLDIGCGTGSLALRLAGSAAQVHGLDISSEMIRIANGKAQAQKVDNVTFHTGPFDDTFRAFEPESLDGICAYSLLHLVDDRSAALEQIFRLLKPGGFFISSTVCLGESWVPYGPLIGVMRLVGKAPMVKIFDKRTLEDEIRESGFVDLSQPDVGAKGDIAFGRHCVHRRDEAPVGKAVASGVPDIWTSSFGASWEPMRRRLRRLPYPPAFGLRRGRGGCG
jgi:ubiquinone/menaquinone biosynthesis C-methylase UbiE